MILHFQRQRKRAKITSVKSNNCKQPWARFLSAYKMQRRFYYTYSIDVWSFCSFGRTERSRNRKIKRNNRRKKNHCVLIMARFQRWTQSVSSYGQNWSRCFLLFYFICLSIYFFDFSHLFISFYGSEIWPQKTRVNDVGEKSILVQK